MADSSAERLNEILKVILDKDIDAAESVLPEKRSVGRGSVVKSTKDKTKRCQQTNCPSVPIEFLEDNCDDIFDNALLQNEKDRPCSVHSNVLSEVRSYEDKNSNMSLRAEVADVSGLVGDEKMQFDFSLNLPKQDLPKKGKKSDSISKTCTSSSSIPPDEVVIEAMKLIFDENVDVTRIFELDKKEPTRLNPSSHEDDRESGRVKSKVKPKKYWSVLDDLLDDNSDDIFGPAFSKQNKSAVQSEMSDAEGEVDEPQSVVEDSLRTSREFVPENAENSGNEDRAHIVDSDESKLIIKCESAVAAISDATSSAVVLQVLSCCSEVDPNDKTMKGKEIEDEENGSDIKRNLCSMEEATKDESALASDLAATLKVPIASGPIDSGVIFSDTDITDLHTSKKVKEISKLNYERSKTNLPISLPKKRETNDIPSSPKELDVISSSYVSVDTEDVKPFKKQNETTFESDRKEQFVPFKRPAPSNAKPCKPIYRFDDVEIEALFGSGKNKSIASVDTRSERDVVKRATISGKGIDLLKISDPLLNKDSSDEEGSLSKTDLLSNRKPERTENLHLADTSVSLTQSLEPCPESMQNAESGVEHQLQQTQLKSGALSFIFQLPSEFLSNAFLLCAAGILLVAVPSLLLLLPVYILALFNALLLTGALIIGAMVFTIFRGKEKRRARNMNAHGTGVEHTQLKEIKYFKAPDDVFKGWMNELNGSYDVNNFHISHLRSVYISLDGSTLRLRTPKKRIPRRAIGSDGLPIPGSFIKQRFYNLNGSKVTTLPEGLVLRRLWSKKYPILIEIPAEGKYKEKSGADQVAGCDDGQEMERLGENKCTHLFLFARTCREKEEWFRKFFAAASSSAHPSFPTSSAVKNASIDPSWSEIKKETLVQPEFPKLLTLSDDQNFSQYLFSMSKVLSLNNESVCDPQLLWINAFISRCTMDVLQESHRIEVLKKKLEKKLLTAKIPYFMDDVRLVEFDLGKEVPLICKATLPSLDDQGLWVDLEIVYGGKFRFTVETKCNLLKLNGIAPKDTPRACKSLAAINSDEEDSGESSTGDSSDNDEEHDDLVRQKPKMNWLLRLADRITSSRRFQNVMNIGGIKKVMENVSSKSLMLSVELHSLKGTMAVNIPPQPTDRIWYGFRQMPDLELSVEVQVGQRQITLTPLTSWIEKKLIVELERALVMPNMDDILFPLMCDHVTNVHVPPTGNPE